MKNLNPSARDKRSYRMHPLAGLAATLVTVALLAPLASAQGLIHYSGHVTDISRNPLPGVTVTAQNEETGESFSTKSTADGSFTIDLPRGTYSFHFVANGRRPGDFHHVPVPHPEGAVPLEVVLPSIAVAARPPDNTFPTAHADGSSFPPVEEAHHDVPGRAFLSAQEHEERGYGLYSYLLIPSPPVSPEQKARDLAVIRAFLTGLSEVAGLQATNECRAHPDTCKLDLNVTYIFLKTEEDPRNNPNGDWVLDHYDFPRAQLMLRIFSRDGHAVINGPFVVSSLAPMLDSPNVPNHYLWQDMSDVPDSLAASWEKEFESQAAKKEFWTDSTRDRVVLEFRGLVANAAVGLPIVFAGVDDLKRRIGWK